MAANLTARKTASLALTSLALAGVAGAATGPKRADIDRVPAEYRHPIAAVAYAREKPAVDGVVDDAEWAGAFSQRALRTVKGEISTRQSRFWMMWDEEHLYVAMRCPLRQGERPIRQHRDPSADTDQIFDDCYEIWVSANQVDPLTGQLDCSTKFLSNAAGAHYDTLYQPNVGNERVSSYETGWQPRNRINDKNEWEMELVIPRASLGITPGPFHDGQQIRILIARNYKRPWEQNSFEGINSFSVTDGHALFVLSKTAPALHLLGVGDADSGRLGLRLAAFGQSDMPIRWQYRSPDVEKEGSAVVKEGTLAEVVNAIELDRVGNGDMRITVTDTGGRPLLDWASSRAFGLQRRRARDGEGQPAKDEAGKPVFEMANVANDVFDDRGDVIKLNVVFNPVRDYAKVRGDFIDYDNRAAIASIEVAVRDEQGAEVARSACALDPYAYANDLMRFDNLPLGAYTVVSECKDRDGKVIETRESGFRKDDLAKKYDWWKTRRGSIEQVIAPWTPVTLKGRTFGVWGREMDVGAAGLPERITTQGADLLARPARLVATDAQGNELAAAGTAMRTVFDKDHRKTIEVASRLGEIDVRSEVLVEFDGMYKVTLTLDPRAPTTVNNLRIILPLNEAMADYIHACAALIRAGFYYGSMPEGKGRMWDCIALGDGTMAKGSFIPYIWLGSPKGGLAWFADSDEGWVPSDETPAMELWRNENGQVELVLNLVSETFTLDAPRTITFGLQASPSKPLYDGWREEKWWCGDTFKNYAHEQNLIFSSVPFAVDSYVEQSRKIVEGQHKAGRPAVPYFIHSVLPRGLVPELNDLFDEWTTNDGEYGSKALCYRGSLIDYMVHKWGGWAEQCGIDGYYVDNMRPIPCDKIEHGCGYRLPDGRIQPVYRMFGTREYFLRSRAAFLEARGGSKLVLHMTNAMILPWIGAADVAYDGEHYVIYPEMGKDFMDFWSLDRLRADVPEAWGTGVNFMHEYQGDWDQAALHTAMRAYMGAVALHDMLPTGNHNGHARNLIAMREAFGIGDADVEFLGYWEKDTGLAATGEGIKLAGWRKPEATSQSGDAASLRSPSKMMLMVVNFGEEQTAEVTIDPAKLGWGKAGIAVTDAEAGYNYQVNRRVAMTEEEIERARQAHEQREAGRIGTLRQRYERQAAAAAKAGKPAPEEPNLAPAPYAGQTWRNARVAAWDGDENEPVALDGHALRVPVRRHDFRLLIVEKK